MPPIKKNTHTKGGPNRCMGNAQITTYCKGINLGDASSEPRDDFFRSRLEQKNHFSLISNNVGALTHLSPCPGFDLSLPFFCRSISSSTPWGRPWSTPSPSRWGCTPPPPTCSKPLYLAPPSSSRNCAVPFPIDRHYFSLCSIKAAEVLEPILPRPTVSSAGQTFSHDHSEIGQEI